VAAVSEGLSAAPPTRVDFAAPAHDVVMAQVRAPEPAAEPVEIEEYDPWEPFNEKMFEFNRNLDRYVLKPVAKAYNVVIPEPFQVMISNGFDNISFVPRLVNSALQGKWGGAGRELSRFLINSTAGLGGLFDPAKDYWGIQKSREDFGQTLGVWGWKRSRYVELPLFGPRTVRDVFGMAGDAPLSPLRSVDPDKVRVPLQGLQLVDVRSQLLSTDALREGAEDDYALVRDAWSQRRDYQIFGDRMRNGEDLPDYLKEGEIDTTVPVDAIPVTVPGG
jgi:phospholipid-binding lipoprotein MlaA